MKRYIWNALLVLGGLAIGLAAGSYLGHKYARGEESLLRAGQVAWAGTLATSQYLEADYSEAKQALLHYIEVLETVQGEQTLLPEKMLLLDLGLTYGRLALVEEQAGNSAAAAQNMAAAVDYLRRAEWKDPSEERLRDFLMRLDRPEEEN